MVTIDNRANEQTPNLTAEQIVAEAISEQQACGSCADAPPYCAQCWEEAHAAVAALRAHGLLSEGAPVKGATALAAIERVRAEANAYAKQPDVMEPCGAVAQSILLALDGAPERLSNHCQKCGALGSVETHLRGCSLDGVPEPAWEYAVALAHDRIAEPRYPSAEAATSAASEWPMTARPVRRRPAGPWIPVAGEKP